MKAKNITQLSLGLDIWHKMVYNTHWVFFSISTACVTKERKAILPLSPELTHLADFFKVFYTSECTSCHISLSFAVFGIETYLQHSECALKPRLMKFC